MGEGLAMGGDEIFSKNRLYSVFELNVKFQARKKDGIYQTFRADKIRRIVPIIE